MLTVFSAKSIMTLVSDVDIKNIFEHSSDLDGRAAPKAEIWDICLTG